MSGPVMINKASVLRRIDSISPLLSTPGGFKTGKVYFVTTSSITEALGGKEEAEQIAKDTSIKRALALKIVEIIRARKDAKRWKGHAQRAKAAMELGQPPLSLSHLRAEYERRWHVHGPLSVQAMVGCKAFYLGLGDLPSSFCPVKKRGSRVPAPTDVIEID